MAFEELLLSESEGVAVITVNRPHKMNSMSAVARRELLEVLRRVRDREEIKVVIITGAGDKAFIAGAEIGEMAGGLVAPVTVNRDALKGQEITSLIETLPKPVIAAVNGAAMGGGMEIMLACDLCVASEQAVFGLPEVKLGLIPGWGGTQRITRAVGKKAAMQFALLGEPISAAEAHRLGLVNEVVPGEQLMDQALQMAKRLMKNSPFAMTMAKQAVLEGMEMPLDGGLKMEAAFEGICFASEDNKEGIAAFIEKRRPRFTGR
ncbi:MAG: enoyl-CoA hydratase/isomerase family protein [Firmicutes bacterium]|nr:enoyl-CoA hydratase/isomerase family protein [Bacillota bacterium]